MGLCIFWNNRETILDRQACSVFGGMSQLWT
jgi:hypothetical protein